VFNRTLNETFFFSEMCEIKKGENNKSTKNESDGRRDGGMEGRRDGGWMREGLSPSLFFFLSGRVKRCESAERSAAERKSSAEPRSDTTKESRRRRRRKRRRSRGSRRRTLPCWM